MIFFPQMNMLLSNVDWPAFKWLIIWCSLLVSCRCQRIQIHHSLIDNWSEYFRHDQCVSVQTRDNQTLYVLRSSPCAVETTTACNWHAYTTAHLCLHVCLAISCSWLVNETWHESCNAWRQSKQCYSECAWCICFNSEVCSYSLGCWSLCHTLKKTLPSSGLNIGLSYTNIVCHFTIMLITFSFKTPTLVRNAHQCVQAAPTENSCVISPHSILSFTGLRLRGRCNTPDQTCNDHTT